MNNTLPKVLIVILNYGTYDLTINLIKELNKLDYTNYSIIVVDNCSPNESANVLREKSKELNYLFIANTRNAGYAAGNNIGIRYGIENGYDYSWILNNDVDLREINILTHMVEIAEKDPVMGCLGPMIYNNDGSICAPYCNRLTFWNMTVGITAEKRYRQRHIYESGVVYRVYGCCMLLRNKSMKDIDCLDERTFLYGEEDILAERLLNKGYSTYYDAEVSVTHRGSATMKRMSTNKKKLQIIQRKKSMDLYLKEYRHFPAPARWLCEGIRSLITYIR